MPDQGAARAILGALEDGPKTIPALVDELDVEHGAVRQAIATLQADGYVSTRRRGYFVVYALTEAGRDRLEST